MQTREASPTSLSTAPITPSDKAVIGAWALPRIVTIQRFPKTLEQRYLAKVTALSLESDYSRSLFKGLLQVLQPQYPRAFARSIASSESSSVNASSTSGLFI